MQSAEVKLANLKTQQQILFNTITQLTSLADQLTTTNELLNDQKNSIKTSGDKFSSLQKTAEANFITNHALLKKEAPLDQDRLNSCDLELRQKFNLAISLTQLQGV